MHLASDAREHAALVDFYVKVAMTLLAAYSVRTVNPIKLGDTPGVGEMLGTIKLARKWSDSKDPIIVGWREFAEAFLGEFSRNIYGGKNFKTIRDELSHGAPIPVDDASATAIWKALKAFSEGIASRLMGQINKFSYATSKNSIKSICGSDEQELCPIWDFNVIQGVIGIYSAFDSDGVYYLSPEIGAYRNPDPANTQMFRERFLGKDPTSRHFGQFVYEITRDIAGFCEDHLPPPYSFGEGQSAGVVFISWTQPNTQGNLHRTDQFRRGNSNRYEWFDANSNTWAGYLEFLRAITNWRLLARRVRIELDEQYRRKQVMDMGSAQSVGGEKIPAVLVEELDDKEFIELPQRADAACEPSKNFTTVFFVVGDAGMGKTEFLLTLARQRALDVEENPASEAPLYLFVSSTGRVLSNLDDAINTSLSITRTLDSQSAKTLCRNGLLVLIVDGFDELLGGSGYDNPLGSLEGWFRDLRGHGVMIASARSAYYMTRYRRALSETTDLNVEHTVANILPWDRAKTTKFLRSYGVQDCSLAALSERDWHLLTIPFFAKAFAVWCAKQNGAPIESVGIFQVVVEQYLERESMKILDQNQIPILNTSELQALFCEIAEMMHLDGKHELEHSDLELCAEAALGLANMDKERPGLKRRLTSLCGLSAGEIIAGDHKFGFSHEVISDCFISLALQKRCQSGVERANVENFFIKRAIHPSVIEWFVPKCPEAAHKVLQILLSRRNPSPVWKKNVGTLWSALLDHDAGMPPHLSVPALVFQTVELRKGQGACVNMQESRIDKLIVSRGAATVDLRNAYIRYLEVDANSTLKLLRNVRPEMIQEMQAPGGYCTTTKEIRSALESVGVIRREAAVVNQDWLDTANFFIESLINRPDAPIVVFSDSFEADDRNLAWTRRLGLAQWTNFVNRLTQCGLASWEPIVNKGRKKSRLVFHIAPAEIARRNFAISKIADFWEER